MFLNLKFKFCYFIGYGSLILMFTDVFCKTHMTCDSWVLGFLGVWVLLGSFLVCFSFVIGQKVHNNNNNNNDDDDVKSGINPKARKCTQDSAG